MKPLGGDASCLHVKPLDGDASCLCRKKPVVCVRVRCCILTTGSSETILVLFVKHNLKISALCELSPKATSPAKKV